MTDKAATVLVYGATGKQGNAIITALLAQGHHVRALVRPGQTVHLDPRVEIVFGDMSDGTSLAAANVGVRQVVLTLPLRFSADTVVGYAKNAVEAAKASGTVSKFVLNTSHPIPAGKTGIAAIDLKIDAEELVFASGLNAVSVRPTLYLGNLTEPFVAPAITSQGVLPYPLPADQAVSWISWEDTARAIAAVVSDPSISNAKINIAGSAPLSGHDLAHLVGEALERDLQFVSVDIEDFAQGVNSALGAPVGDEIGAFYRWFREDGQGLLIPSPNHAETLLGLELTPAGRWAKEQRW